MRIGLIVNPVAGLGGAVALKGSDGAELMDEALRRGAQPRAEARCADFLTHLKAASPASPTQISWLTWADGMGADCLAQDGWNFTVLGGGSRATTADDSRQAARAMLAAHIDCLIFVGGDGTARDILAAVGASFPVIGVPAGVKMHSGVFAVSPRTAALLTSLLLDGGFVAPVLREVRDYDTDSGADEIRVRAFGELRVPEAGGYLQQTKVGGKESEPLAIEEICAAVLEDLPPARNVVLGPGSTCLAIKQALGMAGTLRGCDVLLAEGGELTDVGAAQLLELEQPLLIVSFTRGQGFLFGRGNQQLSAQFLASLKWPEDVRIVASRTKLLSLEQRPLLLDTGDEHLDAALSGLVEIVTGYQDSLLYRLATQAS